MHKYRVAPKEERTYDGVTYHSKAEAKYARNLDLRLKAKDIVKWERQVRYSLGEQDPDCRRCFFDPPDTYVADFAVWLKDPNSEPDEVHEVKGMETPKWKRKKKLFKNFFPWIKLVVVRGRDVR